MAKHSKDFRSRTLIKEALMENDFLKNLSQSQVKKPSIMKTSYQILEMNQISGDENKTVEKMNRLGAYASGRGRDILGSGR